MSCRRVLRVVYAVTVLAGMVHAGNISYFGFSGLAFTPTGSLPQSAPALAVGNMPSYADRLNFVPTHRRLLFLMFDRHLELGLSTAYIFTGESVGGFKERSTVLPIVPSVKFEIPSLHPRFFMAVGAASPYGAYYALDWVALEKLAATTLHCSFATKLVTYHAFGGLSVRLFGGANPLLLTAEGGWGGSLRNLRNKEEAFGAAGVVYSLCQSVDVSTHVRYDADHTGGPREPMVLIDATFHAPRWKEGGSK